MSGYGLQPYGLSPYGGLTVIEPTPPEPSAPGPYTRMRKWESLPPYLRFQYPEEPT